MSERARPPLPIHANPHLPIVTNGAYIVQIPKDQIYRVPPPQNARLAQSYRNPPPNNCKRKCFCFLLLALLLIGVIIGATLGALSSVLNKAKNPSFFLQRFLFIHSNPHPHFILTFNLHNSDSKVTFFYKPGGQLSLSFRDNQIASGHYPTFFQRPNNSTTFHVKLQRTNRPLPKDVQNSKNKKLTFSISIKFHALTKMATLHRTANYDVDCRVTVNKLDKGNRVLSQQCQTKRH